MHRDVAPEREFVSARSDINQHGISVAGLIHAQAQEPCFGRGQGVLALFMRNVDANLTGRLALGRRDRRDNSRLVQLIDKLFRFHLNLQLSTALHCSFVLLIRPPFPPPPPCAPAAARESTRAAAAGPSASAAPDAARPSSPAAPIRSPARTLIDRPARPSGDAEENYEAGHDDKQPDRRGIIPAPCRPAGPLVFASDRLQDAVNSRANPPFVIALLKARLDLLFDDPFGGHIRQRALQSVPPFYPHFPVLDEYKKNRAIVLRLLPPPPGPRHPNRIILQRRIRLHLRIDCQDRKSTRL